MGCNGGGVSYVEEGTRVGAARVRFTDDDDDDGARLYKSGVTDRAGVENSNFGSGGGDGLLAND